MSLFPKWMREQLETFEQHAELAPDRLALIGERLAALPPCDLPECHGLEPHIHIPVTTTRPSEGNQ